MGNDKASKKLKKVKCVNPESGLRQLDCRCPDCYPVESELLMARTEGRLDGAVFAADHTQAQLAAATERAEEFKRIGQQFERDSRKHFEQSCTNLQRAEKAEKNLEAEKKRADELAVELQKAECLATYWKELTKDPKRFETDYYKAAKALNDKLKAKCEDLRKSLEELVRIGDRKTVEWDRAKEVLAAYSKAVKL